MHKCALARTHMHANTQAEFKAKEQINSNNKLNKLEKCSVLVEMNVHQIIGPCYFQI